MATRTEIVTALILIGGAALLVPPALQGQERLAARTVCSDHLRKLGLAAMMYSDDLRFFPHVGKLEDLDGGYTTNASSKITRALLWHHYHDDPTGFVCPATPDRALPMADEVKANHKKWFWGQDSRRASLTASPLVDAAPDPPLSTTTELSYGWTRRGVSSNAQGNLPIAADRSRANHGDGWNVVNLDATVTWVGDPAAQARLVSTAAGEPEAGFLGIQEPGDPAPPGR